MQKKLFFSYFFLKTYPQAHYLQSLICCFKDKFCVKILCPKLYFSTLNTFVRKGKDPDPCLWVLTNGSGRPKSMRIRIPNTNKNLKVGFLFVTDILHFFLTYCYELTHLNLHLNCASFMSTSFLKSLLALNPLLSLQRFALTAPTQLGRPLTFFI